MLNDAVSGCQEKRHCGPKIHTISAFPAHLLYFWLPRSGRPSQSGRCVLDIHFLEDIARATEFVSYKEDVTNINRDGPTLGVVVKEIVPEPFVVPVENNPDLFAAAIHDRRARVAADDVRSGKKIDGHISSIRRCVRAKVMCSVKLLEFLRHVEWLTTGIFFDHP